MATTALFAFAQLSFHEWTVDAGIPIKTFVSNDDPANPKKRLLVVLHGTNRNADEYCADTLPLGGRLNAIVAAPLFDKERFPNWRYHRGGILNAKGSPQLRADWTYSILQKLIKEVVRRHGRKMEVILLGHSAGGQFLNRMCAFAGTSAKRVIVANPGSVIFPRNDWEFSFGMGGLHKQWGDNEAIKNYLAQPMTFLLGTADNKPDENFDTSSAAMRQGGGRLQRSTNCYEYGQKLAAKNGWKFNWRLKTVPNVGHDHGKMFNSPEALKAILEP